MKTRWTSTTSLLVALTMIIAACGDDNGDGDGAAGEASDEVAIPASCDDSNGDEAPADEGEDDALAEDETPAGDEDGAGDLTSLTVGILPIADLAPLYYGIDEGFFEEEGLDVSTEIGQGAAEMVPQVLQGDFQFGFGNYVSLMLARENNVDVQIVSNIVNGAERADRGTNALLVDPDNIGSLEELPGATVAVTTLDNVGEVNVRTTLIANGLDDDVEFVEMPFPDMNAAVESGQVDAAWTAEPFVTLGEASGLLNLVDPMYETTPSMPLAGIFADEGWLEDNPEEANAFYRALQRSLAASSDEEAMKGAIVDHTDTEADQVDSLALANWDPELDETKLHCVAELATIYEILGDHPDMDALVWSAD